MMGGRVASAAAWQALFHRRPFFGRRAPTPVVTTPETAGIAVACSHIKPVSGDAGCRFLCVLYSWLSVFF